MRRRCARCRCNADQWGYGLIRYTRGLQLYGNDRNGLADRLMNNWSVDPYNSDGVAPHPVETR